MTLSLGSLGVLQRDLDWCAISLGDVSDSID